jgi:hypothetical protein
VRRARLTHIFFKGLQWGSRFTKRFAQKSRT